MGDGAEKVCSDCNGRGAKVQLRQIGPGMVQQIQSACPCCKGAGKTISEKDKWKTCKGEKVIKDRKILEVNVEKGMKNGQKIKFSGEADEAPDTIPGDVVFVVQEREHDTFKRKGADLVKTMNISLAESLCGFTRTITHMDGRVLRIDSKPGAVVKPDSVKMIQGEGMPYHGNPFSKGRLFVHFRVDFPATVSPDMCKNLIAALPKAKAVELTVEEEECQMSTCPNLAKTKVAQWARINMMKMMKMMHAAPVDKKCNVKTCKEHHPSLNSRSVNNVCLNIRKHYILCIVYANHKTACLLSFCCCFVS